MDDYTYPARTAALTNATLLREQIAALSLPGWTDFDRDVSGVLHVRFPSDLSPAQKASLDVVIASHDHTQLTIAQQAQVTEAAANTTERQNAKDAIDTFLALANNTQVTAGTLKPILRALKRMI